MNPETSALLKGLCYSCGDPNRLSDCGDDQDPTGLGINFNDADLLDVANSVPPLIGQGFEQVSTTVVSSNSTLKPAVTAFLSITFLAQTSI